MEVLAAGFQLQAESTVLRHPEDTRDWNIFVDNRLPPCQLAFRATGLLRSVAFVALFLPATIR